MIRRRKAETVESSAARTAGWTQGSAIATNVGYVLLCGMLLAGPVAVGLHFLDRAAPVAVASNADVQPGLTIAEQTAGSMATGFVAAWLSATREDATALEAYVSTKSLILPESAIEYRDLRLVSITPDESGLMASAIVAATQPVTVVDGDKTSTQWAPRYYQVLTQLDGSSIRVVGLPAPIAAPAAPEDTLALAYPATVASSQGVGQAAAAFLTAYLTGDGELGRLIAPEADLSPVVPAPYTAVRFDEIRADVAPEGTPANGDQARVLVTVSGTTAAGAELTSTYALTSIARDGRWEIADIDLFPATAQ
jgi:Conjugative transposon protein TcpC